MRGFLLRWMSIAVSLQLLSGATGLTAAAQAVSIPTQAGGAADGPGQRAGDAGNLPQKLRTIGFMTDFDVRDDAIGICKAVMEGIAPGVHVIDITHQVEPFDIAEGARFLAGSAPYFAKDAVFVVVVDPTVGSTRKAIIAKSKEGRFFVLPDNGLLTLLLPPARAPGSKHPGTQDSDPREPDPLEPADPIVAAREISNPEWMIGSTLSSTFHGRDIFSPAGAHLARGDDWTTAGPQIALNQLLRLDLHSAFLDAAGLHGEALGTDGPFGNLILNVPAETFAELGYKLGDSVPLMLAGKHHAFPFVKTFSDVPVGEPLLYIDSRGRLAMGVNQRNFSEIYKVGKGAGFSIARK